MRTRLTSGINFNKRFNKFYISTTSNLLLLDKNNFSAYLLAQHVLPEIRSSEVCKELSEMNPLKSVAPDGIRNGWRGFAPEHSLPVTEVFHASFSASPVSCVIWRVPLYPLCLKLPQWKHFIHFTYLKQRSKRICTKMADPPTQNRPTAVQFR